MTRSSIYPKRDGRSWTVTSDPSHPSTRRNEPLEPLSFKGAWPDSLDLFLSASSERRHAFELFPFSQSYNPLGPSCFYFRTTTYTQHNTTQHNKVTFRLHSNTTTSPMTTQERRN